MCIALLTTSHPDYALIVIDNRDEFILRPTSRPHWWTPSKPPSTNGATAPSEHGPTNCSTPSSNPTDVLSSRDLHRAEKGTWLGITRGGNFAVLTNYREGGPDHPSVAGARSRGAIVNEWLGADPAESTTLFVSRMLTEGGTQGIGGFSLICGKLRRQRPNTAAQNGDADIKALEPLAIISNRHESADAVPWICGHPGEVHSLSNTIYVHPDDIKDAEPLWPKVAAGTRLLKQAVDDAVREKASEDILVDSLFRILDRDTLPIDPRMTLEDYIGVLQDSIYIPAVGDEKHRQEMAEAVRNGNGNGQVDGSENGDSKVLQSAKQADAPSQGFMSGLYGTQRQTVLLVDWEGNVVYKERALWDEYGNPVDRGKGDLTFKYKIQGWDSE